MELPFGGIHPSKFIFLFRELRGEDAAEARPRLPESLALLSSDQTRLLDVVLKRRGDVKGMFDEKAASTYTPDPAPVPPFRELKLERKWLRALIRLDSEDPTKRALNLPQIEKLEGKIARNNFEVINRVLQMSSERNVTNEHVAQ